MRALNIPFNVTNQNRPQPAPKLEKYGIAFVNFKVGLPNQRAEQTFFFSPQQNQCSKMINQCTQDNKIHFLTWRRAFSDIRESFTDSNKERFRHDVIRAPKPQDTVVRLILFCFSSCRSGKLRKFWLFDVSVDLASP